MSDLIVNGDEKPTHLRLVESPAVPFHPSPHSLALRGGIARGLQVAQLAQRAKMMPVRDQKLDVILECLTQLILSQAHLCDAVLSLQGEPREIRFGERPGVES